MKAISAHKLRRGLLKGSIAIACLILLIPQLSYKFYVCANSSAWNFHVKSQHEALHAREAGSRNIPLEYRHLLHLHIDKRYNLEPFIGWEPFSFDPGCSNVQAIGTMTAPEPGYNISPLRAHLLRGPPSALSA